MGRVERSHMLHMLHTCVWSSCVWVASCRVCRGLHRSLASMVRRRDGEVKCSAKSGCAPGACFTLVH